MHRYKKAGTPSASRGDAEGSWLIEALTQDVDNRVINPQANRVIHRNSG
jgi:hypothetical protein